MAHKNPAATRADDSVASITQGARERLMSYPLPEGVDRKIVNSIGPGAIVFAENPVRQLQRAANQADLDEVLFYDARFASDGTLKIEGLLGTDADRTAAAALAGRPEVVKAYSGKGGKPALDPAAAVAPMDLVAWQKPLVSGIQERFARSVNRSSQTPEVRYCRVERARFIYEETGGLMLRFEGIVLRSGSSGIKGQIASALQTESHRLLQRPIVYSARSALRSCQTRCGGSRPGSRPCRRSTASASTISPSVPPDSRSSRASGSDHSSSLSWKTCSSRLAELTQGKVTGPIDWRLAATPTDRLKKSLRERIAAAVEEAETGLDRLAFGPWDDQAVSATAPLVVQGAALAARLPAVKRNWKPG